MFLASVKHFVIFILKCAIQSHLTADIIKNKKLTHVITNSNSFLSLATIFLTFKKKKAYHICPCQSTGLLPCFFCVYVCVCPTCQFGQTSGQKDFPSREYAKLIITFFLHWNLERSVSRERSCWELSSVGVSPPDEHCAGVWSTTEEATSLETVNFIVLYFTVNKLTVANWKVLHLHPVLALNLTIILH